MPTKSLFSIVALWFFAIVVNASTVTYVYTDPQGTPLMEGDANGNITARFDYAPYGQQVMGMYQDGPGYTGHVSDKDTSLIYMQARYYDPSLNRFLSADPIGFAYQNSALFNKYAYVKNNPVSLIDPTGMFPENQTVQEFQCDIFHCETFYGGDSAGGVGVAHGRSSGVRQLTAPSPATPQQNVDAALQEFLKLLRDGKLPAIYDFSKALSYQATYVDEIGPIRSDLGGGRAAADSVYLTATSYGIKIYRGHASSVREAFHYVAHETLHGYPPFWNMFENVIMRQTDSGLRRDQMDALHDRMLPYENKAMNAFDLDYVPTLPEVKVSK